MGFFTKTHNYLSVKVESLASSLEMQITEPSRNYRVLQEINLVVLVLNILYGLGHFASLTPNLYSLSFTLILTRIFTLISAPLVDWWFNFSAALDWCVLWCSRQIPLQILFLYMLAEEQWDPLTGAVETVACCLEVYFLVYPFYLTFRKVPRGELEGEEQRTTPAEEIPPLSLEDSDLPPAAV